MTRFPNIFTWFFLNGQIHVFFGLSLECIIMKSKQIITEPVQLNTYIISQYIHAFLNHVTLSIDKRLYKNHSVWLLETSNKLDNYRCIGDCPTKRTFKDTTCIVYWEVNKRYLFPGYVPECVLVRVVVDTNKDVVLLYQTHFMGVDH